ncbi:MAG: hypothetical protein ACPGQM_11690 [Alphaproteobacteria bacterium]
MKKFFVPILALWSSALSGHVAFTSRFAPIGAAEIDVRLEKFRQANA